ncbi:MAG: hypothetical protein PHR29_06010 [Acholeplasmataceae bacterium]|jgi:hypothetical protein|nr:hypothetical protein [Acholeplasmataceae bacterium]
MVKTQKQSQNQNEQYVKATFSHFLNGNVTYVIRDETGQILAMAIDEPVIKNAQSKIIEKMGKYYEYEKMIMRLEKVE